VVKVAARYQGCGLSLLDLINEGNLGLLEAARRYSPDRGVKFITYAVWWIRQAIMQALAVGGGAVRLPIRKARFGLQNPRGPVDMEQAQQEAPSNDSVEEALNLHPGEMEEILRGVGTQASLTTDGESGEPLSLTLAQTSAIPSADQDLIRRAFRDEVQRMLDHSSLGSDASSSCGSAWAARSRRRWKRSGGA